jgi:negative regulator of flagellin synthesis FlgM
MSSINPIQPGRPISPSNPVRATPPSKETTPASPLRASDRLELSGLSPLLSKAKASDVRQDKIAEIRQQIAEGKYETPEKIDAAIGKIIDELA